MAAKAKKTAEATDTKEVAVVREVTPETLRHNGEQYLNVVLDIMVGDTVVDTLKLGFNAGTTADEIKAEVAKLLVTRSDEAARKEVQTAQDALDATATETISALEGITIE